MIRTQIYLPDALHTELHRLAKAHDTTFSHLIREGVQEMVRKKRKNKNPQREALRFFANPPEKYRLHRTGAQLIESVHTDRDE